MPVSVRLRRGKYRLVEPSGQIARNRQGTPIDGGGHASLTRARAQQRAVNRHKSAKAFVTLGDYDLVLYGKQEYDETLVLWIRVPESARAQLQAALPFQLPNDLHITLLFWPDLPDDDHAETYAAALDMALRTLPATVARVTGWGDFQASEVSVALVSCPEVERYRSIARTVAEPSEVTYGLVPHVTLANERVQVVDLPAVEWPVTELEVVRGNQVLRTIPLRLDKQERPPTTIQTLIMDRSRFRTRASATAWARENGMRHDKVDETENSYRLRQREPGEFVDWSFRTIRITNGVQAVIGRLRER